MKILHQPIFSRRLFTALALVVLLGSLGAYGYYKQHEQPKKSVNNNSEVSYEPPTDEQKEAGGNSKSSTINNDAKGKPGISNTDTPDPSGDETIAVTITAVNQKGETLSVRSLIESVSSSGTCTLTLTKDSTVVTKTSSLQPLANSSTCKGFDISTSELMTGQWRAQLNVSINGRLGSASKDITIQ